MATAASGPPRATPRLLPERRQERRCVGRSPPTARTSGPRAAALAVAARETQEHSRTKVVKERARTRAAMASASAPSITRYTRRGPLRSASRPTGTPASRPINPETVRPSPTWVCDMPMTRTKNSALLVRYMPVPTVLTTVAQNSVRPGPRSGSMENPDSARRAAAVITRCDTADPARPRSVPKSAPRPSPRSAPRSSPTGRTSRSGPASGPSPAPRCPRPRPPSPP